MDDLHQRLLEKLGGDLERVGFVLTTGELLEVKNVAKDPAHNFVVSDEDILAHADSAVATWHTHPRGTCQLSADDYTTFLSYSNMTHYIVGSDGVRGYRAKGAGIVPV